MNPEATNSIFEELTDEVHYLQTREGKSRNAAEFADELAPLLELNSRTYFMSLGYLERFLLKMRHAHQELGGHVDTLQVTEWTEG